VRQHTIDFKEPSGKGEQVTIQTQAGDLVVSAGLVQPVDGRTVVFIQADVADDWDIEVVKDQLFGSAVIRLVQK
jgi:hypothetical protein